jgi:hypothetical protein
MGSGQPKKYERICASKIHWAWTPNPYGAGVLLARLATPAIVVVIDRGALRKSRTPARLQSDGGWRVDGLPRVASI